MKRKRNKISDNSKEYNQRSSDKLYHDKIQCYHPLQNMDKPIHPSDKFINSISSIQGEDQWVWQQYPDLFQRMQTKFHIQFHMSTSRCTSNVRGPKWRKHENNNFHRSIETIENQMEKPDPSQEQYYLFSGQVLRLLICHCLSNPFDSELRQIVFGLFPFIVICLS